MSNETGTSSATQIVWLEKRVAELEAQLDALTQQPESDPPLPGGVIVTDAQMDELRQRHGSPQPSPQVPEGCQATIQAAIARAEVFDDGSDGADAESAQSVVAILNELLTATPSIASDREWISCEDRLPTESDADYRGQVWFCTNVTAPALVDQAGFGLGQIAPHVYWMPTGLRRPAPPVDGGE